MTPVENILNDLVPDEVQRLYADPQNIQDLVYRFKLHVDRIVGRPTEVRASRRTC